ncbi:hypothetical protein FA15DRAFT_753017 [Coprinopsis marcescibilis]|uniref:F-box domain-containing protein n=1 Tax=Coprinopsis marcescibilis TaxID=230819 RepID=A0A5C3LAA5_COPMA|nr:hypothetical protein FA15DRAFT_753017 [Coprinopsis marcescibilis]
MAPAAPILEHLAITIHYIYFAEQALPNGFLSGGAPQLQKLDLRRVSFPSIPQLGPNMTFFRYQNRFQYPSDTVTSILHSLSQMPNLKHLYLSVPHRNWKAAKPPSNLVIQFRSMEFVKLQCDRYEDCSQWLKRFIFPTSAQLKLHFSFMPVSEEELADLNTAISSSWMSSSISCPSTPPPLQSLRVTDYDEGTSVHEWPEIVDFSASVGHSQSFRFKAPEWEHDVPIFLAIPLHSIRCLEVDATVLTPEVLTRFFASQTRLETIYVEQWECLDSLFASLKVPISISGSNNTVHPFPGLKTVVLSHLSFDGENLFSELLGMLESRKAGEKAMEKLVLKNCSGLTSDQLKELRASVVEVVCCPETNGVDSWCLGSGP